MPFHLKTVAQTQTISRWWRNQSVRIVLILMIGVPVKSFAQYFPIDQSSTFTQSPYLSYFNTQQTSHNDFLPAATSFMSSSGLTDTFDDLNDDPPQLSARQLTMSRDSRMIMAPEQLSSYRPTWDFSLPRCRSFNRSKPQFAGETWIDPSETWSAGCCRRTTGELGKIRTDFRNFYCRDNIANILTMYGMHAVISNTAMDQHLVDWYQDKVRTHGTDRFSEGVRDLGTGTAIAPVVTVGVLYYCDRITDRVRIFETPVGSAIGTFASQTTRAFLVGTPTMLFTQLLIGAGRPSYADPTSRWDPFHHDKGVSGHAFAGAMPFITLAQMSDNFWLKAGFYTCSTFVAWSRFNDDAHYFSQILGGWYLAYLSCRAVSKTEYHLLPRGLTIFPIIEQRTTGLGLVYQW